MVIKTKKDIKLRTMKDIKLDRYKSDRRFLISDAILTLGMIGVTAAFHFMGFDVFILSL